MKKLLPALAIFIDLILASILSLVLGYILMITAPDVLYGGMYPTENTMHFFALSPFMFLALFMLFIRRYFSPGRKLFKLK